MSRQFIAIFFAFYALALWTFDLNRAVVHQQQSELLRLSSLGFEVRIADSGSGCWDQHEGDSPYFVLFCIGNNEAKVIGGREWRSKVSASEEKGLLELWVNRFLQIGAHERAHLAAVRIATLVARDVFGAPIREPLPPLLPAESEEELRRPSSNYHWGGAVALLIWALCSVVTRGACTNGVIKRKI